MCKELYGSDARGITIEDINRTLGYIASEDEVLIKNSYEWNYIVENNTKNYEGKFYTPASPQGKTDGGTELGEYKLKGYNYAKPRFNIANTSINVVFGYTGEYNYWLASRGIATPSDYAIFGIGEVDGGFLEFPSEYLFRSDGVGYSSEFSIRPVLPIAGEIPEAGEVLVSNKRGTGGIPN